MNKQSIQHYYDQLASDYDANRFGNSYGQYLHAQEHQIMQAWLQGAAPTASIDLGCGTGRFLQYAHYGVDFSEQMLTQALHKFPKHQLIQASITNTPFLDQSFQAAFSLHVFFHLEKHTIKQVLQEAHRILQPRGVLIIDFPSAARRQLVKYKKEGWHGNTALSLPELQQAIEGLFVLEQQQGVMLFPVHRIPKVLRSPLRVFDSLLCQTFLRHWASYYFVYLRRI
ncbi:class I SAM-dependent methyltransferase [uncultured Thiothrix sp.]|uniref:class I SAM-dependent methyltransferase n=1 Tax=uncultured Thiothrix sp. TaxID=223185 RepID=UPI00262CBB22|nr:class I SAM-dependent methyltransferase [uncultured Thiothrix sp.]